MSIAYRLLAVAIMLVPGAAFAHTGHGEAAGFAYGFMHPLGGLDHLLAMVAIGLFAGGLGGRAMWLVPASFISVMALGGVLGIANLPVPHVEIAIAASVAILGAIIALGVKAPVAVAMGLAGLFAVFHGYAHGAEMPADGSGLAYGLGFMSATALLHVSGLALGLLFGALGEARGRAFYRVAGVAIALAGAGLLVQVI